MAATAPTTNNSGLTNFLNSLETLLTIGASLYPPASIAVGIGGILVKVIPEAAAFFSPTPVTPAQLSSDDALLQAKLDQFAVDIAAAQASA